MMCFSDDNPVPLNLAVTVVFAVGVMLQLGLVPEQAPDQLAKVDPVNDVSVSVIAVPLEKAAEQICGQLMPTGLLTTAPEPGPFVTTVTRTDDP
jgi:hypothetical protein